MQLDQFYTRDEYAQKYYSKLCEIINIVAFDIFLEPSAGNGAFYKLFPKGKKYGLDLVPKYNDVEQMDYFDFVAQQNKKYIVIGNPPFGRVSSLAVQFFNKSAQFADVIAFILPRTFKRVSIQNKLDLNFELVYTEDIPIKPCCFKPAMSAKCVFQIWKKTNNPRQVVIYDKTCVDFTFVKLGPKDINNQPTPPLIADFALKAYGANCGEICDTELEKLRPKSWHWIKSNININKLKKRFSQLDYSMSKDTVRQDSLGQQELIFLYVSPIMVPIDLRINTFYNIYILLATLVYFHTYLCDI